MSTSFLQEAIAWSFTIPEKTLHNVFLTCCGCFVLSIVFGLLRWKSDIQLLRKAPQDASDGTLNLETHENDPVSEDDGICSEHRGQINWLAMLPWHFPLQSRSKSHRGTKPPPSERPLHILHDDMNASVDIVAVHGLAANPDYAWVWQSKNNPPGEPGYPTKDINWLRDLLPTSLSSSKTVQRPLIFIGHSFGGNLIEQSASTHREIAHSTAGVVFLGTPHRGSSSVAWGRRIVAIARLRFPCEDRILKDLEKNQGTLQDRLQEFSRWLISESVPVVCCFEQLTTDYSKRLPGLLGNIAPSFPELVCISSPLLLHVSADEFKVVPEASACIDGYDRISLRADHFKINKFYGVNDPSFKQVYPAIERIARTAGEAVMRRRNPRPIPTDQSATSGQLRKCLQEMQVTNPRDILLQTQKEKRVGHTCEWILERKELSRWIASNESQFLRLIGAPGIGKTMMAAFLVEKINERVEKSSDQVFAYFFFDDKEKEDQRMPTAMLRSLIWQLLLQRNELFRHMQPDLERHKDSRLFEDLFENFSAMWRILQDMLRDDRAGEVFILVDALDECDRPTRKSLLAQLHDLFQETLVERPGKLKLLVTCRPSISDIEEELTDVGVCLRIDRADINNDLKEYIEFKVKDLALRKRYLPHLREKVTKALSDEAEGTFLWISLMIAELGRPEVRNHRVEEKLTHLPLGLDGIYASILRQIHPDLQHIAQFILHFMVAAKRPLTKIEIKTAFAISSLGHSISTIPLQSDVEIYDDVFSACSSILLVSDARGDDGDRATLGFCHQSVKDFLIDSSWTTEQWYHTNLEDSNLLVFQTCWDYLSAEQCKLGNLIIQQQVDQHGVARLCEISYWELVTHLPKYAFLRYASSMWQDHAIASNLAVLKKLKIDIRKAPMLRDMWCLRVAREGQAEVFNLLYHIGAEFNKADSDGLTSLCWAARKGHESILKLLLVSENVDINLKNGDYCRTPLFFAAENGHDSVVKLLLATGIVDIDSKDIYGQTPLSRAAETGSESIVSLLLATDKVDINLKYGEYCRTPLFLAAENGHESVVKLLLDMDIVDLDSKYIYGQTLLSWAAEKGHESIVNLLLATEKVDVNSKYGEFCRTPLSLAAENGHESIVRLLLATDIVDVDSKDTLGQTPLCQAAENGHESIVKLLLATGKVDTTFKELRSQLPLFQAAKNDHKSLMKLLLATGKEDTILKASRWQLPLLQAAENGHESIVKLLLATGKVDATLKESGWQSPLPRAAKNGHESIVKLLLATGKVDATLKESGWQSPLYYAAQNGHESIVKLLLATGKVDASLKQAGSGSPLYYAAQNGHESIVKLLLATGKVDASLKEAGSGSPLYCAAENGHESIVKLLLATGKVDVESKDTWIYGRRPLHWAANNGHESIVKILLATKADVDSEDVQGHTPLSLAMKNHHGSIVKLLLAAKGVDIGSEDSE
ncbi:hypothetical protein N7528_006635 [Penicillium herquei]|nr:hypothetical protein N7528_006635 [Penicillium herquei]